MNRSNHESNRIDLLIRPIRESELGKSDKSASPIRPSLHLTVRLCSLFKDAQTYHVLKRLQNFDGRTYTIKKLL